MKKTFSYFFIVCIFTSVVCHLTSYISYSQTFSFTAYDTIKYAAPTGAQFGCTGAIINNSSTGYYVDVVRLVNDTAPDWQTGFCLDVCYPPTVDSASVYLQPNAQQSFLIDFFPDTVADSSTVLMKFKNVLNPANVIYQKFYGITVQGLGITTPSKDVAVKIFPSPVISGNTFNFKISGTDGKNFSVLIYDVCGKQTLRVENLINGDNYLSLNLGEGIYVYNLVEGNSRIKSGKIAVTR